MFDVMFDDIVDDGVRVDAHFNIDREFSISNNRSTNKQESTNDDESRANTRDDGLSMHPCMCGGCSRDHDQWNQEVVCLCGDGLHNNTNNDTAHNTYAPHAINTILNNDKLFIQKQ